MKYILIITACLLSSWCVGQTMKLANAQSTCTVEGTSTLHDWEIVAKKLNGTAEMTLENGQIKDISQLGFSVDVESMESGKGGMDKNTYKALKSDKYPQISYEFVRLIEVKETAEGLLLKTGGKLTIAGKTKSVYLDVLAKVGNGVSFKGETTFQMTDYGVEPPTALMGTVKTGNEITIAFNVQYLN